MPTKLYYILKTVSTVDSYEETIMATFEKEIDAISYLRRLFFLKVAQSNYKCNTEFDIETNIVSFEDPNRSVEFRLKNTKD